MVIGQVEMKMKHLLAGPSETTELYTQFIEAHNNQDVEAIGSFYQMIL